MSRRVLADLDEELLFRLANRSDITSRMRASFIDDAYRWCCLKFKHPQLEGGGTGEQLQGSDRIIPDDTDIWWYETVQNSDIGRVLEPGDRDVIENMLKHTGVSTHYYWWGQVLYTNRKAAADTNFAFWYIRNVPEIQTGESAQIDQAFDPVIIMKAAEIGLSTVRDYKEATIQAGGIEQYIRDWALPMRESKKPQKGTGVKPRMK